MTMNRILEDDRIICTKIIESSRTPNEKEFFSKMLRKETEEIALSGDLIMSEHDNNMGIYILREIYDEFRVGTASSESPEVFSEGICSLLSTPLRDIGLDNDKTIGEWLREIDYKGINYNANYDLQ